MSTTTNRGRYLNCLHLSDVHFRPKVTGGDSHRVLDSVFVDLKRLEKKHGKPDLIFFTGDLAFGDLNPQEIAKQFDEGERFLTSVRKAFSTPVDRRNLFLVPGNHDVNRSAATEPLTHWMTNGRKLHDINELIRKADPKVWGLYMQRLNDYREMLSRYRYTHLLDDLERLIYAKVKRIRGLKVGIAGINSAWACCHEDRVGGIWAACKWQIDQLAPQLAGADLKFGLIHHPPHWFREEEGPMLPQHFQSTFDFLLHGHEHDGWVNDTPRHTRIAAAAGYEASTGENGYSFVRLNFDAGEAEIWLRKYDPSGNGWVARNISVHAEDGVWRVRRSFTDHNNGTAVASQIVAITTGTFVPAPDSKVSPPPSEQSLLPAPTPGNTAARPTSNGTQFKLNQYVPRPIFESVVLGHLRKGRRLVTLLGSVGRGKSRLAEICAAQATELFGGNWAIVRLEGKAKSRDALAEAIGLSMGLTGDASMAEAVTAALRSKRILLVLDNYESVACRETADFLRQLLMQCEGVCLLVTSWQPVGLDQVEWEVSLDDGMTPHEARELFIARAKLKKGENWVPESEADLARIIEVTRMVPLAVEYAAAWAGYNSLAEIADYLEHSRMPEPPPGFVADIPRHQSLETCLGGLFNQLSADDQKALAVLSVFPETFDAEVVARICTPANAQGLLVRFQRTSLVRHVAGQNRYFMHHFTRAYANGKLAADVALEVEVRKQFVSYFARHKHITCVVTHASTSDKVKQALDWMGIEWRNLLACARHAAAEGWWTNLIQLSDAMVHFFQRRGRLQDGELLIKEIYPWANKSLADPVSKEMEHLGRGTIFNMRGVIHQYQRRLKKAARYFRMSLRWRKGLLEAQTRNSLGSVLQADGQWDKAAIERQRARRWCKSLSQGGAGPEVRSEEAEALSNIGLIYHKLGMPLELSLQYIGKSLDIWQRLKNLEGQASAFNCFGLIYQDRKNWTEALKYYKKRLILLQKAGDQIGQAGTLNSLGMVHLGENQLDEAEDCFCKALEISREVGDVVEEAGAHRNLGSLYRERGRYEDAARETLLGLEVQSGSDRAKTFNSVGWIYYLMRNRPEAMRNYELARELCENVGDKKELRRTMRNIAILQKAEFGPPPSKTPLPAD